MCNNKPNTVPRPLLKQWLFSIDRNSNEGRCHRCVLWNCADTIRNPSSRNPRVFVTAFPCYVNLTKMAFWWPLLVLGLAFAVCKLLFMLIPPNVPSIEVDASDSTPLSTLPSLSLSLHIFDGLFFTVFVFMVTVLDDGNQTKENSFIYVSVRYFFCSTSVCVTVLIL